MRFLQVCNFFFLRCILGVLGVSNYAVAVDCEQLDAAAYKTASFVPGYASGYTVTGTGRLQFYSAPTKRCKMTGVFIIPEDTVTVQGIYEGFAAIMYFNLKDSTIAIGWVDRARLKANGTGIAPRQ